MPCKGGPPNRCWAPRGQGAATVRAASSHAALSRTAARDALDPQGPGSPIRRRNDNLCGIAPWVRCILAHLQRVPSRPPCGILVPENDNLLDPAVDFEVDGQLWLFATRHRTTDPGGLRVSVHQHISRVSPVALHVAALC
eukprot:1760832-Prymnesium_polylepis.2